MRVALDCRTISSRKTGDRTYALNLSRALVESWPPGDELQLFTWEPTPDLPPLRPGTLEVQLKACPRWSWTPIRFPLELKRRGVSLAHVQYLVPPLAPCPIITTVHDVAFRRYPGLFPLKHRILLNLLIPLSLRRARHILTCSRSTQADLQRFYRVPNQKITVTPYAADPCFRPQDRQVCWDHVRAALGLRDPFVLGVGVLQPRKNLPRLVRAFGRLGADFPHRLVLVGKEGWGNRALEAACRDLPADRRPIFTGYVPDSLLPALYGAADLFAYPSLYEGFGLPPLEAMACGTPVLTSNTSSLPEVVGSAARLVDPWDENSIEIGLREVLANSDLRLHMSESGIKEAERFSWHETAVATLAAYRRVGSLA